MTEQIERRITLDGCVNFRDLGGYSSTGGRMVKWRRLFRSDSPSALTEADVETITGSLGLVSVVDLRSNAGTTSNDGRGLLASSGIGYHQFPFLEARGVLPPTSGEEVDKRLTDMYQWILMNSGGLIAQAFAALAQPVNQPALFHCSAGKDRTGVLAATILDVLGVNREEIVTDFLATNEVIDDILARLRGMPGFVHSTREGIMAPRVAIEKYLDVTQSEFGGSEAYLLHHGVQQSAIDNFRQSMLE
ncbi:MAG: tyrosine-protein phosphatase [SAR202 cluster bacterium]|nr:tyrosine-protein phosphatase [SAR202 cluster bacterium]|tara:strand:- start:1979 stop:2719 length:741 start_codon:yes stop_codon:yes gene_type:complete